MKIVKAEVFVTCPGRNGRLNKDAWRDDSRQRFKEAFRVLRPHGVLIF